MVERRLAAALPPLDDEAELVVYRVAQESLTNVARHSGAARVSVELEAGDDAVELVVYDDGSGPGGAPPGNGIRGMRERAILVGGRLSVGAGVARDAECGSPSPPEARDDRAAEGPPPARR